MSASGKLQRLRIPSITDEQWDKIQEFLAIPRQFNCAQLEAAAGISRAQAGAIPLVLHSDGLAKLNWHIHHRCSEFDERCVSIRPFESGFMPLPWVCTGCGATVRGSGSGLGKPYDFLTYELVTETTSPLTIE